MFTWKVAQSLNCPCSILFCWLEQLFCFSAVDTILKQEPLSEGQKMRKYRKYTSRVHVEDICKALMATIYAPPPR